MKYLFVDAETDSLYGRTLSIAAIACDETGKEESRFYGYLDCSIDEIENAWVRENVYPYLRIEDPVCRSYSNEKELLIDFWEYYKSQGNCLCVGDVIYPVESNVMRKCVEMNLKERIMEGPFPFLDLSSMLYGIGIDPLSDRGDLVDCSEYQLHNSLDDARMCFDIWRRYIFKGE